MATTVTARWHGILRYSSSDAVLIALSLVDAGLLLSMPSIPLIALGLWWTANTVAHNFIHTPFFRARSLNRAYSLYLSALMGFPQELWRERHEQIVDRRASQREQQNRPTTETIAHHPKDRGKNELDGGVERVNHPHIGGDVVDVGHRLE